MSLVHQYFGEETASANAWSGELAGVFKGTRRLEQALGLKSEITGAGRNGVKKKGFVKHRRNNSMLVY